MLFILSPPALLARDQSSHTGRVDDPSAPHGARFIAEPNGDRLRSTRHQVDLCDGRRSPNFCAGLPGTPKDFLVESCAVQLVRWQPSLIAPAQFTRFAKRGHVVVLEPKTEALLNEMIFVQVLSHPKNAPHEKRAHFDGRLPHPPR